MTAVSGKNKLTEPSRRIPIKVVGSQLARKLYNNLASKFEIQGFDAPWIPSRITQLGIRSHARSSKVRVISLAIILLSKTKNVYLLPSEL